MIFLNLLFEKDERVIQTTGKASEEEIKAFLQRSKFFHHLSEKLRKHLLQTSETLNVSQLDHGFENLAAKFSHPHDKPVHHEAPPSGFVEYAPTETLTKKQLGDFQEVKEGFRTILTCGTFY